MADITFDRLISLVDSDGHDTEYIERFQFACAVKNLTGKTIGLTTRDIQQYILAILKAP